MASHDDEELALVGESPRKKEGGLGRPLACAVALMSVGFFIGFFSRPAIVGGDATKEPSAAGAAVKLYGAGTLDGVNEEHLHDEKYQDEDDFPNLAATLDQHKAQVTEVDSVGDGATNTEELKRRKTSLDQEETDLELEGMNSDVDITPKYGPYR